MIGDSRKGRPTYHLCWPRKNNRGGADPHADLATVDDAAALARIQDRDRLQRQTADIERKQEALLRQAQDGAPEDPFAKALRQNFNELAASKNTVQAEVAQLDAQDTETPAPPTPSDMSLLDAVPYLRVNLARAPQPCFRRSSK